MKVCETCGREFQDDVVFCPRDGHLLSPDFFSLIAAAGPYRHENDACQAMIERDEGPVFAGETVTSVVIVTHSADGAARVLEAAPLPEATGGAAEHALPLP